jgi:predicted adenine nucleotide alpha hydrolase (AANH) superfamily ATPase
LRQEGFAVTGQFYNPNIHPYREFAFRLDSYRHMAEAEGLPATIVGEYGLSAFLTALKPLGGSVYQPVSEERCRICYRMRMEKTASVCKEMGFPAFSTTLLVSPYQNHDLIREAGETAALAYGLVFLYRDFRPGFRRGQAKAKETGLYRQGYCGCIFSEYERYGSS